jgi:hypothetical protein
MTPKPIALGLTFCDYVIVEEKTHKMSLVGTFANIAASRFPAVTQPFSIVAVLTDGLGPATVEVIATRLDTDHRILSRRMEIHFPNRLTEVGVHFRLKGCYFPSAGWYEFVLLVDSDWIAQRRLRLYQREE